MASTSSYADDTLVVVLTNRFNQFRSESEVQNEAKGGYLEGHIQLPQNILLHDFECDIFLNASQRTNDNPGGIHPNLLYHKVNHRLTKDERSLNKVRMTNSDWKVTLSKKGDKLVVKKSGEDVTPALEGNTISLGGKLGLKLNVVKAAQKIQGGKLVKNQDQSLKGVLLARLKDAGVNDENSHLQTLIEYFKAAGPKLIPVPKLPMMHMAKVCVRLRSAGQDKPLETESEQVLLNSNAKFTCPLDIAKITSNRLCTQGNVRLTIVLKFEVDGRFITPEIVDEGEKPISFGSLDMEVSGRIGILTIPPLDSKEIKTRLGTKAEMRVWLRLRRSETDCVSRNVPLYLVEHVEQDLSICFCQTLREELGYGSSAVNVDTRPHRAAPGKKRRVDSKVPS